MDKFAKETHATAVMLNTDPTVMMFDIVGSGLYMIDPKDIDFVVLVEAESALTWLPQIDIKWDGPIPENGKTSKEDRDWQNCGEVYDDQNHLWRAIRKGDVNLLVTTDRAWFDGCSMAAAVCAALNLQSKADRVRVHRVIREGYDWETARDAPMREGVTS